MHDVSGGAVHTPSGKQFTSHLATGQVAAYDNTAGSNGWRALAGDLSLLHGSAAGAENSRNMIAAHKFGINT